MEPHRYRVGEAVRFAKTAGSIASGTTPPGVFRVVGLLPEREGRNQYRVQSTVSRQQRIATENQIFQHDR